MSPILRVITVSSDLKADNKGLVQTVPMCF